MEFKKDKKGAQTRPLSVPLFSEFKGVPAAEQGGPGSL